MPAVVPLGPFSCRSRLLCAGFIFVVALVVSNLFVSDLLLEEAEAAVVQPTGSPNNDPSEQANSQDAEGQQVSPSNLTTPTGQVKQKEEEPAGNWLRSKKSVASNNETAALCLVQKDQLAYIDEWSDYHAALGFHLYIVDNSIGFQLRTWWEDQQTRNPQKQIHLLHMKKSKAQISAYKQCANRVKMDNHTWISFLDMDEFLVLKTQHDHITDFCRDYVPRGHLGINWLIFGTSGQSWYQNLPITKRFQCQLEDTFWKNKYIKSIMKVEDLDIPRIFDPHIFPRRNGTFLVHTNGQKFNSSVHQGPYDVAAIHHYYFQSTEEWLGKRLRGDVYFGGNPGVNTALHGLKDDGELVPRGSVRNNLAWNALKRLVPSYSTYDQASMNEPIDCSEPPGTCSKELKNIELELVHIPKTGGTALETAAAAAGIRWGACHYLELKELGCCAPDRKTKPFQLMWNWPSTMLGEDRIPENQFTVVRDPYTRCVSAFYCKWEGFKGTGIVNQTVFNQWIQDKIHHHQSQAGRPSPAPGFFRFYPQWHYIFDDVGNQIVMNVLYYERLQDDFHRLMKQRNLPVRLPSHIVNDRRGERDTRMTVKDLFPETIMLINDHFHGDFEKLGYSKLDPVTKERVSVSQKFPSWGQNVSDIKSV